MAAVDVVAPGREADNCLRHQPVRDRDNAQQRGRVETPAVAPAPRPALKTSLWGSRGGALGCDQGPAQRAVLRTGGVRARGPGPDPGGCPAYPSAGNQQAWDFVVCTDPEQLAQLAKVWRSAGHVAGSAATIALIAPTPGDGRSRELIPYDLGQATLSIMVAAADLGMAALMQRSATRSWHGGCWAFPRTGSAPG